MNIIIKQSTKPEKKFTAIIDNKKSIHFGQKNASDFTQHKNPGRKNYMKTGIRKMRIGVIH